MRYMCYTKEDFNCYIIITIHKRPWCAPAKMYVLYYRTTHSSLKVRFTSPIRSLPIKFMQTTRTVRILLLAFQLFIGFQNNSIICHNGPHSENHDHYIQGPGEEFQLDKLMHDRQHIMEDLDDLYGAGFGEYFLSKEEMEFLFFKSHDLDMNDKLDGLEMLYAIGHVEQDMQPNNLSIEALKLAETNVDEILAKYDTDNDGYLNYDEFATGNRNQET